MTQAGDVAFFPIRHHSPACAAMLARALDELRPRQVVIELPGDFGALAEALVDDAVLPPVAIVSLPADSDGAGRSVTYPFCVHSPEYVALRWARANGAAVLLMDLPAQHPAWRLEAEQDGPVVPASLFGDWRLDHNAYVEALCARRGVRNGAELWDALFEAQGGGTDWRGFFRGVGLYCAHIRQVSDPARLATDGTDAREACMAKALRAAKAGEGPVAVVAGGFHVPALEAAWAGAGPTAPKAATAPAGRAYLVRYGFRQLDQASGYGAGVPHPAWYDALWGAFAASGSPVELTLDLITTFAAGLRATEPQLAPPTPTLLAAAAAAERLASLRALPWPGRAELIDAVRSTAVKGAVELGRAPVLEALDVFLTGDRMGELPPGAAQPPIVEAVRRTARAFRFNLDTGAPRSRELDVLRRPAHADASRFLHALVFVDAGFAHRTAGPDPMTGWRGESLFEAWSYAWSPMVEQRLIALAGDGDTLEALAAAELERRLAALTKAGAGRLTAGLAELLLTVAGAGMAAATARAAGCCEAAVVEDPEFTSVVRGLALTSRLQLDAESPEAAAVERFRAAAGERLLLLLPRLADAPPERLPELQVSLRELAALVGDADGAVDRAATAEAVASVLEGRLSPALDGALAAFGCLIGILDEDAMAERVRAATEGAFVAPGERAASLTGCLAVAPRLLLRSEPLLAVADRLLTGLDAEAFLVVLPELRLGLGQLTPAEIDEVAGWAARRHGLAARDLRSAAFDPAEVADNLRLSETLEATWRADGLDGWMAAA